MHQTLVIMAAGIGSRFGKGIKQLAVVGPNGEIIMDYSIRDAKKAGFDKVVFIIREEIKEEFNEIIGKRIEEFIDVEYVFQEVSNIPEKFKEKFKGRTKPFGTGHAVLLCKEKVKEPFVVINADDYYGESAFSTMHNILEKRDLYSNKEKYVMGGYFLKNTLSENGTVTRGVCKVNENNLLLDVKETYDIIRKDGIIKGNTTGNDNGEEIVLDDNTIVSMNMWGLDPSIFSILENKFNAFLENEEEGSLKGEFLLPVVIGETVKEGISEVLVSKINEKWFGMTYESDLPLVRERLKNL